MNMGLDLHLALRQAYRALEILETQAAAYTSLSIPPDLKIALEDKRCEVKRLEKQCLPVKYRLFLVSSLDAMDKCEETFELINLINDKFHGGRFQIELTNESSESDIWIGIVWKSIKVRLNNNSHELDMLWWTQNAKEIRKRRENRRPAIIIFLKTDPKDYAPDCGNDPEQVEKFKEDITRGDDSVIFIEFKDKREMNDIEHRFEFLVLADLFSIIKRFLKEDLGHDLESV